MSNNSLYCYICLKIKKQIDLNQVSVLRFFFELLRNWRNRFNCVVCTQFKQSRLKKSATVLTNLFK